MIRLLPTPKTLKQPEMNGCEGYFCRGGKGKPIQAENCKGSPRTNAIQVS